MPKPGTKFNSAFFGTSDFSVTVLKELEKAGIIPSVIIAPPDAPVGRKMVLTPPPVKIWANEKGIPVLQPAKLSDPSFQNDLGTNYDVFIIASYGKIIPKSVLDIPKKQTLNVHPSLLPKYRGASPIQSAILADDRQTGVTIMRVDEEMDHGPIVAAKEIGFDNWPPSAPEMMETLAGEGGKLLAEILPDWLEGKIAEIPQDHASATYTKKIEKEDGLMDLSADPRKNFLKIQALQPWPNAFFFAERGGRKVRVIVKDAKLENGELKILRVIPEGSKEMDYEDFMRGMRGGREL